MNKPEKVLFVFSGKITRELQLKMKVVFTLKFFPTDCNQKELVFCYISSICYDCYAVVVVKVLDTFLMQVSQGRIPWKDTEPCSP